MSNVKSVDLEAKVEFCWMDEMEDEDAAFLAKTFFTPSIGLKVSFKRDGMVPNEHGGRTAMYQVLVTGSEALSWGYLDKLEGIFKKYGKNVTMNVLDLEA